MRITYEILKKKEESDLFILINNNTIEKDFFF